jgi:beta-glucosidase
VRRLLRLIERVTARTRQASQPKPDGVSCRAKWPPKPLSCSKTKAICCPSTPTRTQTIAVIGENAKWAQIMGGGSSQVNPHYARLAAGGIRKQRVGADVTVAYEIGVPIHRLPPLMNRLADGRLTAQPGLTLDYFHNLDLSGDPGTVRW